MSFNIDEWKHRYSSCKDAETRCQMLKADSLIISSFIARDPAFVRWMLDNRLDGDKDNHEMALYCYKQQLSNDHEIIRCFRFPIRQVISEIKLLYSDQKVESMGVEKTYVDEALPKLIKYCIQHYYIACAQGPRYELLRADIQNKINRMQCHISLFGGNKDCIKLKELCKDLRTKINMLVTKIIDEFITTDHWSCQLVTELVLFVI